MSATPSHSWRWEDWCATCGQHKATHDGNMNPCSDFTPRVIASEQQCKPPAQTSANSPYPVIRGCMSCMTEFQNRIGTCPVCSVGQIDTYSAQYWADELIAKDEHHKMADAKKDQAPKTGSTPSRKNPYQQRLNSFRADLKRVCKIHGFYIEPNVTTLNGMDHPWLGIGELKKPSDLSHIDDAI